MSEKERSRSRSRRSQQFFLGLEKEPDPRPRPPEGMLRLWLDQGIGVFDESWGIQRRQGVNFCCYIGDYETLMQAVAAAGFRIADSDSDEEYIDGGDESFLTLDIVDSKGESVWFKRVARW